MHSGLVRVLYRSTNGVLLRKLTRPIAHNAIPLEQLGSDATDIIMDDELTSTAMHKLLMSQASRSAIVQRKTNQTKVLDQETKSILKDLGQVQYFSNINATPSRTRYLVEFVDKTGLSRLLNQGRDGVVESHMVEITTKKDREKPGSPGQIASKSNQRTKLANSAELKKYLNNQDSMDDQIEIVVEQNLMSSNEIRSRYLFLLVLEKVLQKNVNVPFLLKPFGSGLTGGGMPGSDLDILMLTENYVSSTQKVLPKQHMMMDTEAGMRAGFRTERIKVLELTDKVIRNNLDVINVELVLSARVPILKFYYPLLDLHVDIAVDQFHGDNFSRSINWYIRFDKRVLPMLLVIRKWAESRSLLSHGVDYKGFTPFMLQMLVLVYLMRVAVIPPIKSIGRLHRDELIIQRLPIEFIPKSQNTDSVSELLYSFFNYFSAHSLMGKRLCPLFGHIRARRHPNERLIIQNPFDTKLNVADHCSSKKVLELVEEMRKTTRILTHRLDKIEDRNWGLTAILFGKG